MSDIEDVLDLVRSVLLRGKVKSTTATAAIQELFVETLADDGDDAQHFQPYGLRGAPSGGDCIVIKVGGAEDDMVVVVACGSGAPTDLLPDEVALYSKHGQEIRLKTDGSIVLTPKVGSFVMLGSDAAAKAMALAEDVDARLTTLQAAHDAHMHGGVTPGGGSTAVPSVIVGALATVAATKVKGE